MALRTCICSTFNVQRSNFELSSDVFFEANHGVLLSILLCVGCGVVKKILLEDLIVRAQPFVSRFEQYVTRLDSPVSRPL